MGKHYCKNCKNYAYGFCTVNKGKVSGNSYTDCSDYIFSTTNEPISSEINRRKESEAKIREDALSTLPKHKRKRPIRSNSNQALRHNNLQAIDSNKKNFFPNNPDVSKQYRTGRGKKYKERNMNISEKQRPSSKYDISHSRAHKLHENRSYMRDESLLNKYVDVEKERNLLRERLRDFEANFKYDKKLDLLHDKYTLLNNENQKLQKKLDTIKYELDFTIARINSFPTSDITAQRVYTRYLSELLKFLK